MVNQASQGIMGSCCRRLEHIKWTLAVCGLLVTARLEFTLVAQRKASGREVPSQLVSSAFDVILEWLSVTQEAGKVKSGWWCLIRSTSPQDNQCLLGTGASQWTFPISHISGHLFFLKMVRCDLANLSAPLIVHPLSRYHCLKYPSTAWYSVMAFLIMPETCGEGA